MGSLGMAQFRATYRNCTYTATYSQSGDAVFPWTVSFVRNATDHGGSGIARMSRGKMSEAKFASYVEKTIKDAVERTIDSEIERSG